MNKKGFTLVELLSVVVILGILLVIAVPKINDLINSSKEKAFISSAQLIARKAEDNYLEYNTKGILDEITCEIVTNLTTEYEICDISFNTKGRAFVTMVGKGKYENLTICYGSKEDAKISENCTEDYVMIDLELNGGKTKQKLKYLYQPGDTIELETPIRTGYNFLEWKITKGDSTLNNNILTKVHRDKCSL